jgi:ribosomal protein S18 acetylase RimI-like enzyme
MTPVLRSAKTMDIPGLVELLRLLFALEEDFSFNAEKQQQGLALLVENKETLIVVAETEDGVVGMATGQTLISTACGGKAMVVEDVVVAPAWRGQGLGSQLVAELQHWGHVQGMTRMQLLADRNNRAGLGFYEKTGWQTTALICLRKRLVGNIHEVESC